MLNRTDNTDVFLILGRIGDCELGNLLLVIERSGFDVVRNGLVG